jgi:hypothetical protein
MRGTPVTQKQAGDDGPDAVIIPFPSAQERAARGLPDVTAMRARAAREAADRVAREAAAAEEQQHREAMRTAHPTTFLEGLGDDLVVDEVTDDEE